MTRRFTLSEAAHARAKSVAGGLKKHKRVVLFSSLAREKAFSFSLSLVSEDFLRKQSASDDSDRRRRIQEREAKISNERRLSTTTTNKRTFFILDLRFHVIDGIRRLHFQGDGFAR